MPPRAAYSPSASVGRRYSCPVFCDSQARKTSASSQLTSITGRSPDPSRDRQAGICTRPPRRIGPIPRCDLVTSDRDRLADGADGRASPPRCHLRPCQSRQWESPPFPGIPGNRETSRPASCYSCAREIAPRVNSTAGRRRLLSGCRREMGRCGENQRKEKGKAPRHFRPSRASSKFGPEGFSLLLGPAVHQPIVGIPTPWEVRVCPFHPEIKCVVKEQV